MIRLILCLIVAVLSPALFAAMPDKAEQKNTEAPPTRPAIVPELVVSDLKLIDQKIGSGKEAVKGKAAVVHYTGWLYDPQSAEMKGKKFDSSRDRNQPFSFPLGAGRVIKGWDQGVAGMKVGGKRTLIIPAAMAYGPRGAGGVIPPDSPLIFDVELMDVKSLSRE